MLLFLLVCNAFCDFLHHKGHMRPNTSLPKSGILEISMIKLSSFSDRLYVGSTTITDKMLSLVIPPLVCALAPEYSISTSRGWRFYGILLSGQSPTVCVTIITSCGLIINVETLAMIPVHLPPCCSTGVHFK